MQSPIDLNGALEATVHAPIEYRNYFVNSNDNNRFYNGILQNNGHSIVWHLHSTGTNQLAFCWKHGKCPSIRNGPFAGVKHTHAYYLLQLHFHWGDNGDHWNKGSEHTVDGMQYPLEMHMVHIEDRYINSEGTYNWTAALADPNGLAVLAIFFQVDPKKPQNMQPLEVIDETLEDMANVPKHRRKRGSDAEEEAQMEEMARFHEAFEQLFAADNAHRAKRQILHHTEVDLRLNPGAFIRKATNRGYYANEYSTYWTYHGSLTTPCCNEVVTWVVFDRVLHITQVQVNAFTHKFPNTFRTPWNSGSNDLNDRVDTMCGREIRLIHDQIEHHSGGFWG
jgi:carbonic anhydrase